MFEFDPKKSQSNKEKHGIDFVEAQQLWDDSRRAVIKVKELDEPRFALFSTLKGRHWTAIYTLRNEAIRLISVRRSRVAERKIYESH